MSSHGGVLRTYEITPVVDTNLYANNDLFFNPILAFDMGPFSNAIIHQVAYHDAENQNAQFEIFFVGASTSWGTLNAGADITAAKLAYVLGHVEIGGSSEYVSLTTVGYAQHADLGLHIHKSDLDGNDKVYIAGKVSSGTPNYSAANSLNIHITVEFF